MIIEFDRQLLPAPETQTDEPVVISSAVHDKAGFYYGHIKGLTSNQLIGTSSTSFGVYSAVLKGGTRYEVIEAGDPSATQILFERLTGRLIASNPITVYVTYPFYARVFHWWEQAKLLNFHGAYVNDNGMTIYEEWLDHPDAFIGMQVTVPNVPRGAADAVFALRKNSSVTNLATVTMVSGANYVASPMFASRVKFAAGDKIVIVGVTVETANVMSPVITLLRG